MTACGNFSFKNDFINPEYHNSTAGCGKTITSGFLKTLQDVKPPVSTTNAFGVSLMSQTSRKPFKMAICEECNVPNGRFQSYRLSGSIRENSSSSSSF